MRRAAACMVLEDLITLFTEKSDFDLYRSQQPKEAYDRFVEYRKQEESYRAGPKLEIMRLAADKDFRREVVAQTMSPAAGRAYWEVRSVTMAASERRHQAAVSLTNQAMTALPSVETVKNDFKGESARDTSQRTEVALRVLYSVARLIPGASPKADAYSADSEANEYGAKRPVYCNQEPGCDESVTGATSRSYWCYGAYWESPWIHPLGLGSVPLSCGGPRRNRPSRPQDRDCAQAPTVFAALQGPATCVYHVGAVSGGEEAD